MATPSDITPILAQAWEKDPDQHFFEFLFTVFQTNGTLFSMGELTHDQIKSAFEQYLTEGTPDGETVENDTTTDAGDPARGPVSAP